MALIPDRPCICYSFQVLFTHSGLVYSENFAEHYALVDSQKAKLLRNNFRAMWCHARFPDFLSGGQLCNFRLLQGIPGQRPQPEHARI